MNGETKERNGHAHTWEAALIDQEIYGKTNSLEGHTHQISIPVEHCFADGMILRTSTVDGHDHDVVVPIELLRKLRPGRDGSPIEMEEEEDKICNARKPSLKDDEEDDTYGPDGASDDDDVKTAKKPIDEDGLPIVPKKRKRDFKVIEVLETFSDGNPKIEHLEDDRVLIRDQRIFKVGVWNGQQITESDIISMANNFQMLQVSFEPPIKVGHSVAEHMRVMGECSAGWVTNVRADLPWLVGDFDVPMDVYRDYLRTKKLRFKSIEMQPNFKRDGKEYGPVLTGLALLGINNPAVNDLGPVALPFSCKEEDIIRFTFDDGGEDSMSEEDIKKFQDQIDALKKEKDEESKKFAAVLKRAEESEKVAVTLAAKLRQTSAQTYADNIKSQGKLLPKDEKLFVEFMLTLKEEQSLTFSQDDGSEKKMSQVEMFKALVEAQKPQIDLDTQSIQTPEPTHDLPIPATEDTVDGGAKRAYNFGEHSAAFARVIEEQGLKVFGDDVETRAKKLMAENEGWTFEQALGVVYGEAEGELDK